MFTFKLSAKSKAKAITAKESKKFTTELHSYCWCSHFLFLREAGTQTMAMGCSAAAGEVSSSLCVFACHLPCGHANIHVRFADTFSPPYTNP